MASLSSSRAVWPLGWTLILSAIAACGEEDAGSAAFPAAGGATAGSGGARTGSGGQAQGGAHTGGAGGSAGSGGSATGSGGQAQGGSQTGGSGGGVMLSERYPDDVGLASDPAVLFFDDFEAGWGRWDGPTGDTDHLTLETDAATARGGMRYLRSTVTTGDLAQQQYISSSTRVAFDRRVDEIYWRFHARFVGIAPNPHHWVRMAAGDEAFSASGLANTVPAGDDGFWFDFDASSDDQFNFYVYWYGMRSGRCNDGSATPGCAGDQGTTYYYGNVFEPPGQAPFPRDAWVCVEIHARANAVGSSDGELSFWVNDALVGDYAPGRPVGTWLRAQFHTGGCGFSACTDPVPFEGFNFRSSADVGFKSLFLDAYYERDTSANKRQALEDRGLVVSDEQTILYDDVVAATQRIGCPR